MRYFSIALITLVMLLTACGGSPQAAASVTLTSPADSAVIYSSALYAAGTAQGVNEFLLRLTNPEGSTVAETLVKPGDEGIWSVELVHGHTGDPSEITVSALAVGSAEAEPFASVRVLLAGIEHRPEGVFGDVLFPTEGAEVGGDFVRVEGRASGVLTGQFTVDLIDSFGAALASETVTISDPFAINDTPWSVELAPGEFTGSAVIQVTFADDFIVRVPVVVSAAAG